MDMAATAASPYRPALELSTAVAMLASPCRQKEGKPVVRMFWYTSKWREVLRGRSESVLRFARKQLSSMQKLMNWLRMVAMAAPAMPMSKVKMNSGSSTMFRMPPAEMPTMASVAFPSARSTLLSTNEAHMNGAPYRMYCA